MHVCVSVCTCSPDKNTMSYRREIKGGKSLENLLFPPHFQARLMSKNNHHHCFSALITEFVWKCFFCCCFFSSGTLLSSSGGIISSADVPCGIQRDDGGRGNSLSLSHSSRLEDVSRSPFDALQNEHNIALLSSEEISKRQLKELKPLWSECRAHSWLMSHCCHLFRSLSYLCNFYQIKYVKIKLKSEGNATYFKKVHSDSIRLIASDFYKIDANLKKNYVNLSKNDQSSYYWKRGVTLAYICGAD